MMPIRQHWASHHEAERGLIVSPILIEIAVLAATGLGVWLFFGLLGPIWGTGYLIALGVAVWFAFWLAVRLYIRRRTGRADRPEG
jgi:hypothetical protein